MHSRYSNLNDLLLHRTTREPERLAFTYLKDGEKEEANWTYKELGKRAQSIAVRLLSSNVERQRVILMYPPGLDVIAAFCACLYAGAIAVPIYPPRVSRNLLRLRSVVRDSQPVAVLTTRRTLTKMQAVLKSDPQLGSLEYMTTDDLSQEESYGSWSPAKVSKDAIAFLQYTSGSTAEPKGVMVSHSNLLDNEISIQKTFDQTERSVIIGWLPLYHDMGLIGNILQTIFVGARAVLMSPLAFLQQPFRWLNAISSYRGTTSGGPNFAYDLCLRKITEAEESRLDLSSWKVAFNGAEPVRADTLAKFAARFGKVGFNSRAIVPCYGLAEATLLVSGSVVQGSPSVFEMDADALAHNEVRAASGGPAMRQIVNCGRQPRDTKVRIVDPESRIQRSADDIGEIWVSGPSVAQGYWNRVEESEQVFKAHLADTGDGPFLRTGDLGFLRNGELYITGRLKDLIIIRGRNHYPQDIEATVEAAHPSLRPGCGAAFSIESNEEEVLVIFQEIEHPHTAEDVRQALDAIRRALAEQHEIEANAILLMRSGSIPKTSSGKIQRHACRNQFLSGTAGFVGEWRATAPTGTNLDTATSTGRPASAAAVETLLVEKLAALSGIAAGSIRTGDPVVRYAPDSMMAVELAHAIERELAVTVPISSLLQDASIHQVAEELFHSAASPVSSRQVSAVEEACGTKEFPLSQGQKSLWYLYRLAPESAAYNLTFAAYIPGELDVPLLFKVFRTLVDRHAALRTTFHAMNGEPLQRISSSGNITLEENDATLWDDSTLESRLEQEARLPFNLEQGPLLRISIFRRVPRPHVIMLAVHHIVADLWSLALLLHEAGQLYAAERSKEPFELPTLTSQYQDYVRWQQEMLSGEEGMRLHSYWGSQLAGELPVMELPTDKPRPAVQTYRGVSKPFRLNKELTQKLKVLSQENGTTLYTNLVSAFQVLLSRYCSQQDVLIGSPTACRGRAAWSEIFGYFVNVQVLRGRVLPNLKFSEFLAEMRKVVLEALKHQDYPLPTLVERLQPERYRGYSPLFQVLFSFEKTLFLEKEGISTFALGQSGGRLELNGLVLEPIAVENGGALFDLSVVMGEIDGTLCGAFQYNTDLFGNETMARMISHWEELLSGIVAAPTAEIRDLPLLTAAERRQLLLEWNQTKREYPPVCAHELFERQAALTPTSKALIYDFETLTYEELNQQANRLAHYLKKKGLRSEDRIGICIDRSPAMVIALLAVLKTGAAYIPLDPRYPGRRLAYMLEDSRAALVLTQAKLLNTLSQSKVPAICLEEEWKECAQESGENLERRGSGDGLAYVIYTSGSTGEPKGVMVTHRGLVNYLAWCGTEYRWDCGSGSIVHSSLSFDLTVTSLHAPLLMGGCVKLLAERTGEEIDSLAEALQASLNSLIKLTPSHLRALRDCIPKHKANGLTGDWIVGGEALRYEDVNSWLSSNPGLRIINEYGPTEATVGCCIYKESGAHWKGEGEGAVPIGKPVANAKLYVLDKSLEPVPVGITGELYIGGEGLARGYMNRPDLTAERFVPNPFDDAGERLYRTGDRVKWLASGDLEFLGRMDQQLKVRGYRIEPGEIEAALESHEQVKQAVVISEDDGWGSQRLAAFVATRRCETTPLSTGMLLDYLKERLPMFVMPATFMFLEELPLTQNGKVDHRALRSLRHEWQDCKPSIAQTQEEEILAGIWRQVLKLDQPGFHDDFFGLGGHSLLATQIVSRIRAAFGIELPLLALIEEPTISGLARRLKQERQKMLPAEIPPILPESRNLPAPLSFAQQRLWFLDQIDPENTAYNEASAFHLIGELDLSALEKTFEEIVRRHDILRTSFQMLDGQVAQSIAPFTGLPLPLIDLLQVAEQEEILRKLIRSEAERRFDLVQGPLLRILLVRLAEDDHVLLVTMHHIITDGWSTSVLIKEFTALYEAFVQGRPSPLDALAIQYADFARWQRRWLTDAVLAEQLDYWRNQLADLPALELGMDFPRPFSSSGHGERLEFHVNPGLTAQLETFSRSQNATLFMTLLAAFQLFLGRWCGQEDVAVGADIANRTRLETEPLIGFFVNILVLRSRLKMNGTFNDLLAQVRQVALQAYARQDVPFERLVEEIAPDRTLGRTPLFQALIVLHNLPQEQLQLPGVVLSTYKTDFCTAKFDLVLSLMPSAGGLTGALDYATDLFARERMERFVSHYSELLEHVITEQNTPLWQIPLLREDERRQLLAEWNQTRRELPGLCVHELFEVRVNTSPDNAAVVFGNERLTYAELNARANQLAHYLRRCGLEAEMPVALCCERSSELIVGMLGILKAGGFYVPLDPSYPSDRLAMMMEDSGASILVTQERLLPHLPASWAQVVLLDDQSNQISAEPVTNLPALTGPGNLAYLMYTSGSTGKPKGVAIEHRAILRLALAEGAFDVAESDVFVLLSPFTFDASTLEIWAPLINGAQLAIFPPFTPSLEELGLFLEQTGVTVLWLTAGLFHQFGEEHFRRLQKLRYLLTGGDVVSIHQVRTAMRLLPGCVCINGYGPTENTTFTTCHRIQGDPGQFANFAIGKPISNTTVFVLDEQMEVVPIGVAGELYTGGLGLARGYFGRSAATAARFVPNPFAADPGERLYRTGDRVCWRADGTLEFLGRLDRQVKIRGFRIELEEIEAVLAQVQSAQTVIAVVREDVPGDKRLVAYAAAGESSPSAVKEQLRAHARAHLPDHMVPSDIVVLPALQLTANGKVDRKALPPPEYNYDEQAEHQQLRTAVEEIVAGIWSDVLRVKRVGAEQNFFEIGGHSLFATQVVSRVRQVFGVDMDLRFIFENPTVRALAKEVEQCDPHRDQSPQSISAIASTLSNEDLILANLDTLSEAEIDELMSKLSPSFEKE